MLTFHISIHARPAEATVGPQVAIHGCSVPTLLVSHDALATPFAVTFEQAGESLGKLERLFFEPDGSFVWTSGSGEPRWQVDGNLFDRAGRLLFVDLKGSCPPEQFDRLLAAFGCPAMPVMFQMVREAVFLDETAFRRYAAAMADPKI